MVVFCIDFGEAPPHKPINAATSTIFGLRATFSLFCMCAFIPLCPPLASQRRVEPNSQRNRKSHRNSQRIRHLGELPDAGSLGNGPVATAQSKKDRPYSLVLLGPSRRILLWFYVHQCNSGFWPNLLPIPCMSRADSSDIRLASTKDVNVEEPQLRSR